MAVLEVELPSGFTADKEMVESLRSERVKRVDVEDQSVHYYFDQVNCKLFGIYLECWNFRSQTRTLVSLCQRSRNTKWPITNQYQYRSTIITIQASILVHSIYHLPGQPIDNLLLRLPHRWNSRDNLHCFFVIEALRIINLIENRKIYLKLVQNSRSRASHNYGGRNSCPSMFVASIVCFEFWNRTNLIWPSFKKPLL